MTLGVLERPFPPSGKTGSHACIVRSETSIQVGGPADIRSISAIPLAGENVYEKQHRTPDRYRLTANATGYRYVHRLDVHENVLRKWVRDFASDLRQAFPGRGQTKPEQPRIGRLRRDVAKLKAEMTTRLVTDQGCSCFGSKGRRFEFSRPDHSLRS